MEAEGIEPSSRGRLAKAAPNATQFISSREHQPLKLIQKRSFVLQSYARGDTETLNRLAQHGLHHLSAVTATAIKVTRAVWRVCIDQRDYVPAGRPTTHS